LNSPGSLIILPILRLSDYTGGKFFSSWTWIDHASEPRSLNLAFPYSRLDCAPTSPAHLSIILVVLGSPSRSQFQMHHRCLCEPEPGVVSQLDPAYWVLRIGRVTCMIEGMYDFLQVPFLKSFSAPKGLSSRLPTCSSLYIVLAIEDHPAQRA